MYIYQSISFCDFTDAFHAMNRYDNFEYEGLKALFEYLEQYAEECETPVELDVIALCCEYTRYEDLDELKANYTDIETFEQLEDHTTVIYFGTFQCVNSPFIISNF